MKDRSRLTMIVVQVLIASVMVTLLGRLYYMQVVDGERYREAALNVQSRDIVTPANRGLIVDNIGVPLAINRAGLEITVDRSIIDKLPDRGATVLRRVAAILKLEYQDVFNRTRLCPELEVGERAGCWNGTRYQPIPITKAATERQAFAIIERSDQFPGVDASPVSIRYYPSIAGENAAHTQRVERTTMRRTDVAGDLSRSRRGVEALHANPATLLARFVECEHPERLTLPVPAVGRLFGHDTPRPS